METKEILQLLQNKGYKVRDELESDTINILTRLLNSKEEYVNFIDYQYSLPEKLRDDAKLEVAIEEIQSLIPELDTKLDALIAKRDKQESARQLLNELDHEFYLESKKLIDKFDKKQDKLWKSNQLQWKNDFFIQALSQVKMYEQAKGINAS